MLTPEREAHLREDHAEGINQRIYPTKWFVATGDLLAEIDRLRSELDAAHDRVPAELGWDGATTEAQRLRAALVDSQDSELRLGAEIDRLRAELEGAKDAYAKLEFTVSDLNAENEALREAGHVLDQMLVLAGYNSSAQARWREVAGER